MALPSAALRHVRPIGAAAALARSSGVRSFSLLAQLSDADLTDDQREFQSLARSFAQNEMVREGGSELWCAEVAARP